MWYRDDKGSHHLYKKHIAVCPNDKGALGNETGWLFK